MAATEVMFNIEELSAADAPAGLTLSDEAGWNQTIDDWRYFLEHGTVLGMRDGDGRVIATAALLPFPPVTWISMVLVAARWRRRGLAARLMTRCIKTAQARKLEPWLDATPAGAAVYGPMGFAETGLGLTRLRRTSGASAAQPKEGASITSLQKLLDADRHAMGFDRSELIRQFADRANSLIYEVGSAVGLVRAGRKARQIGPLYADNEAAAVALLEHMVEDKSGSLVIDLSAAHSGVREFLLARGFVFERPFSRMRYGEGAPRTAGDSAELIAVAGPEFG
jgi:GNAT superfamily N-acetyltransferase